MCRNTMDIKKVHVQSDCLRSLVTARFGLRLRVSLHRNQALGHWRKSTTRNLQRDKKRAQMAKLAKNVNEVERKEEIHSRIEESRARGLCRLPPPGAMAPENTTQYLMDQFYDGLRRQDTTFSTFGAFLQSEEAGSPQTIDTTLDSYDDCLSFQQRDFEEQFGSLW